MQDCLVMSNMMQRRGLKEVSSSTHQFLLRKIKALFRFRIQAQKKMSKESLFGK